MNKDIYHCTTIAVPKENKEKYYCRLSIKENTRFLEFIAKKMKERPELFKKRPTLIANAPFRIPKEQKKLFDEVQNTLREHKISFSSVFRLFFDEFTN